ncbi:hypothetical protein TNCV_2139861 [Trichonephila clavipes]|uniref:Uncharacterized protein n=1 Tax=Trichonephila clavipes TaxID=2585209 RepID=A0A8X6S213_TRICX|nr:hypothetical protein TNCV_2139861 [Trichonephila clavipes]
MIVQFRNEKVSNHGSIPITIDCNVVAFIVFEEGFHLPIKRTKQSVFLDVLWFHQLVKDKNDTHRLTLDCYDQPARGVTNGAIVYCLNSGSGDGRRVAIMDFGAPLTIGKAYLKIIMSSFLGFCEWNTRNRWRDGQETRRPEKKKSEREKEEKRARKREGLIKERRIPEFCSVMLTRNRNANEKKRLADWTETSCGLRAMVQRREEKEQQQQHINETENILLKGHSETGVRNSDQKSFKLPDSGAAWNSLRFRRFMACHISFR